MIAKADVSKQEGGYVYLTNTVWQGEKGRLTGDSSDPRHIVVAHTGLEPVISALRGQRVNQLHQCALAGFGL